MHLRHRAARLGAPRTVPSRLARLGTLLPQVSHELREMSLAISDQCNVSFASFWDLGLHIDPEDDATERAVLALADRALAFAAEARLFNADGTSTLLVASVSACGAPRTPVTMRCASDSDGYCAPISRLSQRFKDYATDYAVQHNELPARLKLQEGQHKP